jgi:16S rRNA (cytidine1402-2'-O)-methyltransferase
VPLYVVATPIGNLGDLAPRVLEVLTSARVVLCEDTRHTRKLFAASDCDAPELWSCHAHNEMERSHQVLEMLSKGMDVAIVSDAGTPGISDPGGRIVEAVHAAGQEVKVVPGPSSVIAALSASGFPASPFHFIGFPPRKMGALRARLLGALKQESTFVLLESGKRAGRLLTLLAELAPEREVVIGRELTKVHEQITRVSLSETDFGPLRGEVVLVVGPGTAPPEEQKSEASAEGLKAIAATLARRWDCSRREAYQRLLELEKEH